MTTQFWRRALTATMAVGFVAAGSVGGVGLAHADVLDDLAAQYDTGSGGGQISQLIHSVIKLRAQGYGPSKGNLADIQTGMDHRPNEMLLIKALKSTIVFQQRNEARRNSSPQNPIVIGGTQGGLPPGILPNTGGSSITMGGGR